MPKVALDVDQPTDLREFAESAARWRLQLSGQRSREAHPLSGATAIRPRRRTPRLPVPVARGQSIVLVRLDRVEGPCAGWINVGRKRRAVGPVVVVVVVGTETG